MTPGQVTIVAVNVGGVVIAVLLSFYILAVTHVNLAGGRGGRTGRCRDLVACSIAALDDFRSWLIREAALM